MTIRNRLKDKRLIIIAVLSAIVVGLLVFIGAPRNVKEIACTADAQICSDGSAVGRNGPNCEFSECPETKVDSSWMSFSDPYFSISFRYPEKIPAEYISAVDWPPVIRVIDEPFSCSNAGSENERAGISETKVINGRNYCVTRESEGAAGSVYTSYAYKTTRDNMTLLATFSLRSVQCLNYEGVRQEGCLRERKEFNIDIIADKIMESLRIGNNIL